MPGRRIPGRAIAVPRDLDAGQSPSRSAEGQSCVAYPTRGPGYWVISSSVPINVLESINLLIRRVTVGGGKESGKSVQLLGAQSANGR